MIEIDRLNHKSATFIDKLKLSERLHHVELTGAQTYFVFNKL